jgi:hypothetical protein
MRMCNEEYWDKLERRAARDARNAKVATALLVAAVALCVVWLVVIV